MRSSGGAVAHILTNKTNFQSFFNFQKSNKMQTIMKPLSTLYQHNLALLTDLYQLTMAYGYWQSNTHERPAVFHLFFRQHPFSGGFTVAAGLENILEYLEGFHFEVDDIAYLRGLKGNNAQPLFSEDFLQALLNLRLSCDVDAVPEGTVVFPHAPMLRIQGPLWQVQLLETALLNMMNFPSLIATKAARVCLAAQGDPVLEFGLRRAQGIDGGLTAARSAYIGGCVGTSNVLAGKLYNIPIKGTHAHSWIMSFDDEQHAFDTYAKAMPNNCVFLVDTYDTLEGVGKAIESAKKLREQGHEMIGIRLDSGDLNQLSQDARKLLDAAGFADSVILASNDLDEYSITELKKQGAKITVWGVGTKLATAYEQAALGGVYKLSAIQDEAGEWQYRVKLSNDLIKVSNPGILQVRRYKQDGQFVGDVIWNTQQPSVSHFVPLGDVENIQTIDENWTHEDLLVPVLRQGKSVYQSPDIHSIRARTQTQLQHFSAELKVLTPTTFYCVGLEENLFALKQTLVQAKQV
jgi:nicotinate phosphoribosyltransferase